MEIEIVKPFGPSIVKIKLPDQITDAMNEFTDEEIEKIQKRIAEKHGYKLVDSKLELYCVKK